MGDIISEAILSHTVCGKDYKNFVLVCKSWYVILNRLFPGGDVFCNHLLTLLEKLPNENWNYARLSGNHSMTLEYIKTHPDCDWKYDNIFALADSMESIITNNLICNDHHWLTYLKFINLQTVIKYHDYNWDYKHISAWFIIDWDYVDDNPDLPWNYECFSYNKSLTPEFFLKHLSNDNWNYTDLSYTLNIEFILNNLHLPWDWRFIYENPSITWDNIWRIPEDKRNISYFCAYNKNAIVNTEKYLDVIDFSTLSRNIFLTESFIMKHINAPWDFATLSRQCKLTWNIVKNNLDKPWNFENMGFEIPLNDLIQHIDKSWYYPRLSYNVSLDYVKANPNKPWSISSIVQTSKILEKDLDYIDKKYHKHLSTNPTLTWRLIINNMDKIKWDFNEMSVNEFSSS